jgi:hypothetical protein
MEIRPAWLVSQRTRTIISTWNGLEHAIEKGSKHLATQALDHRYEIETELISIDPKAYEAWQSAILVTGDTHLDPGLFYK